MDPALLNRISAKMVKDLLFYIDKNKGEQLELALDAWVKRFILSVVDGFRKDIKNRVEEVLYHDIDESGDVDIDLVCKDMVKMFSENIEYETDY